MSAREPEISPRKKAMVTATTVGLIRWRVFFARPARCPDWVHEEAAFRAIWFRFSSEY